MRNGHLGYINKELYTDVKSYEVFEDNGKTYAVEVKRKPLIKPDCVTGGFSMVCLNNDELYKEGNFEIVEIGKPIEIIQKNGSFGYWHTDVLHFGWLDLNEMSKDEFIEANRKAGGLDTNFRIEFGEVNEFNQLFYRQVLLTKSGKDKKAFKKLGSEITAECLEYYDYNF